MKLARLGREAGLHDRPPRHQAVREEHSALDRMGDQVALIALDDDLKPLAPGPAVPEHGMDVCRALAARPPGPPVVLHAKAGMMCDQMRNTLESAGWRVAVVHSEGQGVEWVRSAWLPSAMGVAIPQSRT